MLIYFSVDRAFSFGLLGLLLGLVLLLKIHSAVNSCTFLFNRVLAYLLSLRVNWGVGSLLCGVYSREASISQSQPGSRCSDYSRVAPFRGHRLIEEIRYIFCLDLLSVPYSRDTMVIYYPSTVVIQ